MASSKTLSGNSTKRSHQFIQEYFSKVRQLWDQIHCVLEKKNHIFLYFLENLFILSHFLKIISVLNGVNVLKEATK